MSPDDPRHGTANGYNNHRCRCDRCREAIRRYMRSHRGHLPRSLWEEMQKAKRVHGANRYAKGCRCDVCKKGAALRRRAARRRKGAQPKPSVQKYREEAS